MTNAFVMSCDESNDRKRIWHSKCPIWCPGTPTTPDWSIDFTSFTRDVDDFIRETDTVLDSFGNEWSFEGGKDPDTTIGLFDHADNPCTGSAEFGVNGASGGVGGTYILRPTGFPIHRAPFLNREQAWTAMLSGSVSDGTFTWLADSFSVPADSLRPANCEFATLLEMAGVSILGVQEVQYNSFLSDLCGVGSGFSTPGIRSDYSRFSCSCVAVAVDPCSHELTLFVRLHHKENSDPHVYVDDGGVEVIEDPTELVLEVDCSRWWLSTISGPGSTPSSLEVETPTAWPSRFISPATDLQNMRFQLATASGSVYLERFQMWGRKLSVAELRAAC